MVRQYPAFQWRDLDVSLDIATKVKQSFPNLGRSVLHTYLELSALYELAIGFHDQHNVWGYIVQFGLYYGGSACVMGLGLKHNRRQIKPIIALDPYPEITDASLKDAYHAMKDNIKNLHLEKYVCPIIFDDVEFINDVWNLPVRIAMIDANHTYEDVQSEIAAIRPYVVSGGWMVFDDYRDANPGVVHAINEFIDTERLSDIQMVYNNDPAADALILLRTP